MSSKLVAVRMDQSQQSGETPACFSPEDLADPEDQVVVKELLQTHAPMIPPSFYQWSSEENFACAKAAFVGAVASCKRRKNDELGFFLFRLHDIYEHDRARRACKIVGQGVEPVRWYRLSSNRSTICGSYYDTIPFSSTPLVARVFAETYPDNLLIVANFSGGHDLYAQFGDWAVPIVKS